MVNKSSGIPHCVILCDISAMQRQILPFIIAFYVNLNQHNNNNSKKYQTSCILFIKCSNIFICMTKKTRLGTRFSCCGLKLSKSPLSPSCSDLPFRGKAESKCGQRGNVPTGSIKSLNKTILYSFIKFS